MSHFSYWGRYGEWLAVMGLWLSLHQEWSKFFAAMITSVLCMMADESLRKDANKESK